MSPRGHTCPTCGAVNPEDVPACLSCGTPLEVSGAVPGDDVEIEVYDLTPPADGTPTTFERTLATARANVERDAEGPLPEAGADPFLQTEIADGFKIRQRRRAYRIYRPRNLIIFGAALAAVAVAVYFTVRGTMAQLPQYNYGLPADAAETERVLAFAAAEENRLSPLAPATAAAGAILQVSGVGGKVFIDGHYVGDAPSAEIPVAAGIRHVLVKRGGGVAFDVTVEFKAGERYHLEPTAATALYGALGGGTAATVPR